MSSKHSGVPEDSKSPTLEVLGFNPTLGQSGVATITAPLTNLLKKSAITYEWEEACDEAFGTLKGILVKAPVLKLPDFNKEFQIHSDASDFAIGGVLVQEGRPVAFESKKLSETKRRWPTHEKEMWAVIHCLKTWGHYIGSKDVVVWTDNVTLKYFATQPKLSSKQVRWQDTLALFNVAQAGKREHSTRCLELETPT